MKKAIAIVILICILLTACNDKQPAENTTDSEAAVTEQSNILKIHSYNPDTLHPLYTKNNANLQMLKLIFEPLIICDEEQRPLPVLADNFSLSEDGLSWTVNLKKNVSWHDGSKLTAFDAENTYNSVIHMGTESAFYDNVQNIDSIISLTEYTIVFNLKRPQTNFINLLGIPIVKQTSQDDFSPVGTGPYIYDRRENKSIYLSANENWRGGSPHIKNIEVKLLPDKDTSFFSFEAKAIDVVTTNMLNWSRYTSNLDTKIIEYPSGSFNFLYINQQNEFLSKIKIRQAIANSVNKRRINTEVLLSHGAVTDTIFSPNWWMYRSSAALYPYDTKLALERINDINPDKKKISLRLLVNDENDIKFNVAGIIKECLEEAGIEVILEFAPWEEFLRRVEAEDYDMYLGEINYSPEVNPAYLLGRLEKYNPIMEELQRQVTDNGRKRVYYELQMMIAEDIPLIPLYFDVEALFCSNHIGGEIRPLRENAFFGIAGWNINGV